MIRSALLAQSLLLTAAVVTLAGCNLQQTSPFAVGGNSFQGTVYGGQQPISGATIQLYAVGNSGYGSQAQALILPPATSGVGGSFSIRGDYTCPSSTVEVYIVATGGNPGLSGGNSNPNIALMAALGPCGQLGPSTHININELTTVGSVWSLSGFMTGIGNIGTSATNAQGLTNAFSTVNNLVNTATGSISAPPLVPLNATLPVMKLNLLGNILAACVNSSGGTAGDGSVCGRLFTAATVNGVAPTDTITAAMNIAQHPNAQVGPLSLVVPTNPPFQPYASSVTDFNISIVYSGGGLSSPTAIAVDGSGNLWLTNSGNNSVTELASNGSPLSGSTGYTAGGALSQPSAIAIDEGSNVWVANAGVASVIELNSAGSVLNTYTSDLNSSSGIAINATGNAWIANSGLLVRITPSGTTTNYPSTGTPTGILINPR